MNDYSNALVGDTVVMEVNAHDINGLNSVVFDLYFNNRYLSMISLETGDLGNEALEFVRPKYYSDGTTGLKISIFSANSIDIGRYGKAGLIKIYFLVKRADSEIGNPIYFALSEVFICSTQQGVPKFSELNGHTTHFYVRDEFTSLPSNEEYLTWVRGPMEDLYKTLYQINLNKSDLFTILR